MRSALLSLVALLVAACSSSPASDAANDELEGVALDDRIACVCGEEQGDVVGCFHPVCLEETGNPDNPLCACGPLIASGNDRQTVAFGSAQSVLLGQPQTLHLESGGSVRGTLESDDSLSVVLETAPGRERTLAYDELAPRSVYRLGKGRTPQDDGPGQLELANYARDHGLYAHSRRHYRYALAADPSLEDQVNADLSQARDLAASEVLAKASRATEQGDETGAKEHLSTVINEFPGTVAAEEAGAMLADLEAREAEPHTVAQPDSREAVAKALAKSRKHYEKQVDRNNEGLRKSGRPSQAIKYFNSSIKEGGWAMKDIEKQRKKMGDDPDFKVAADELAEVVEEQYVQTTTHLAGIYMARTSYNKAMGSVNQALAVAPDDQSLMALRTRIETSATSWGGGYGYGGWYVRGHPMTARIVPFPMR